VLIAADVYHVGNLDCQVVVDCMDGGEASVAVCTGWTLASAECRGWHPFLVIHILSGGDAPDKNKGGQDRECYKAHGKASVVRVCSMILRVGNTCHARECRTPYHPIPETV
jgi:hypothetical protein